mmetsp:Transcript_112486/g.314324  ORF Transcript_112486/g.314324 Transcript_112486/m.314324 type:complete len:211 (+) Transcript_112486:4580-5212(+)
MRAKISSKRFRARMRSFAPSMRKRSRSSLKRRRRSNDADAALRASAFCSSDWRCSVSMRCFSEAKVSSVPAIALRPALLVNSCAPSGAVKTTRSSRFTRWKTCSRHAGGTPLSAARLRSSLVGSRGGASGRGFFRCSLQKPANSAATSPWRLSSALTRSTYCLLAMASKPLSSSWKSSKKAVFDSSAAFSSLCFRARCARKAAATWCKRT